MRKSIVGERRKKVAKHLFGKYGNKCFYCDKKISSKQLQIDHFEPLWGGGGNSMGNYRPSCSLCNRIKSNYRCFELVEILGEKIRQSIGDTNHYRKMIECITTKKMVDWELKPVMEYIHEN
jgi:hypothetical protein